MTFWTGWGNRLRSSSEEETRMMSLETPTVTGGVSHIWDTMSKRSCRIWSRRGDLHRESAATVFDEG